MNLKYIEIIFPNISCEFSEEIIVESIPMCNQCLFEIKSGNFICDECGVNLCSVHLEAHLQKNNSHSNKIIKLKL
jgi:hypothetical protein